MADSKIQWTNKSWNPVVGCKLVSPGCDNCYAAREASGRLAHLPQYTGLAVNGEFTGEIRTLPERLDQPLHWRKPARIFVNSMSDLFHTDVPDEFILQVWSVMRRAPQHTFQILTKRPARMRSFVNRIAWRNPTFDERRRGVAGWLPYLYDGPGAGYILPNVWLGVSIETNRYAYRADALRETEAAVRWVSAEPLLGPLDQLDLTGIDWLVVGGETGKHARPMHPEWALQLRDMCQERQLLAGIGNAIDEIECLTSNDTWPTAAPAFFFKQWGSHDEFGVHMNAKRAGRELEGRTYDEYPAPL